MNSVTRQVKSGFKHFLFWRWKPEFHVLRRQIYNGKYQQINQASITAVQPKLNNFTKHFACGEVRAKFTSSKDLIKSICITNNDKVCEIKWNDEKEPTAYHSTWLRLQCQCEQCSDKTSQKTINPAELSPDVKLVKCELKEDNCIHIQSETNNEIHEGLFPVQFLQANSYSSEKLKRDEEKRRMQFHATEFALSEFQYDSVMKSDKDFFPLLKDININGVGLLKNVPTNEVMVTKIAELFGPVMFTIYGEYFKVKSEENPINIAYSSLSLGFHMDLIYYESPPGLQLLHCVRFDDSVQGGESQLIDAFQVAEEFRKKHPAEFKSLCTIPATFQKIHYARENPVHMIYQRPHILLSPKKDIIAVNWAPEFEGPLSVDEKSVEPYYKAYLLFAKFIQASPHIKEFRLETGDVLIFNNRRMLHARKEFVLNGGTRELQGCYVNIDEYKSRLQYLSNKFEGTGLVHRVGNQDWF